MGLNRMMMGKGAVKGEDGSKKWSYAELNNTTISFTVPAGIKRIKVKATLDEANVDLDYDYNDASIKNKANNKT